MDPERFRQIRNLFQAALERDASARADFLKEACLGDEPLQEEVELLLVVRRVGLHDDDLVVAGQVEAAVHRQPPVVSVGVAAEPLEEGAVDERDAVLVVPVRLPRGGPAVEVGG